MCYIRESKSSIKSNIQWKGNINFICVFYMKLVIRTVCFHFACIIVFAMAYYYFKHQLASNSKENFSIMECIFLSTTIQAGVGITDIIPTAVHTQALMMSQQLIMIMANVFTVYIFTM